MTPSRLETARGVASVVAILAAVVLFGRFLHSFQPLQHWLFFRYAGYWLATICWAAGCLALGHAVVRRLTPTPLPPLEHLGTSFATGVAGFFVLMSLAGHLGLFHAPLFFLLPALMLASGGRSLVRWALRWRRHARRVNGGPPRVGLVALLPWLFGLGGLALVYFVILTPENVQFDSRWKHLALAEQYAHVGGIDRFGEGWTVATNPHLVSILFTWAFLLPWGAVFDRVELAAHMEFMVLLWTVAMIPAAVRRIVPRARASGIWAVRFAFPGIFLYDSSLSAGGDHVAALFALPAFTVLLRVLPALPPRGLALLGILLAGGTMPKLTAGLMLLPGPLLALAVRGAWLLLGRGGGATRANLARAVLAFVGAALLVTAPFWLRNFLWYGDPLYPSLHRLLPLRPWHPDAANLFEWGYKDYQFWRPSHDLRGLLRTLRALVDFSFVPNDYPRFHGSRPVFGSLFTLLLLPMLLRKAPRRYWGLVGVTHLALFVWYGTHHQDRYLQTLMPWMAAATGAALLLLWRQGTAARVAVSLLLALQIVWGADLWFLPNHAMIGSPVKKVVDLLAAGYAKNYDARFAAFQPWVDAGRRLAPDARVMLHDNHNHLGLARATVSDWGGWQYGISYGRTKSAREVVELWRSLGVTDVVWQRESSKGWDTVAGDLAFFEAARSLTAAPARVASLVLAPLPATSPAERPWTDVFVKECGETYAAGLYDRAQLTVPVFGPGRQKFPAPREPAGADLGAIRGQLDRAGAALIDRDCARELLPELTSRFQLVAKRAVLNLPKKQKRKGGEVEHELWLRR